MKSKKIHYIINLRSYTIDYFKVKYPYRYLKDPFKLADKVMMWPNYNLSFFSQESHWRKPR